MRIAQCSGLGFVWGAYRYDVLDREDRGTVAGGEGALLNTSFALAARGHDVECFYPGEPGVYRGVEFRPLSEAKLAVLTDDYDAVVSWSDEDIIKLTPPTTVRAFSQQLNDMPPEKDFWANLDVVISPSMIHAKFLSTFAPENADVLWCVMGAGVDPQRYAAARPLAQRDHVVSWWSSPDRGLHHLLLVWPRIRAAVPDAELRIFYHLDRFISDVRGRVSQIPDVPWRGRLMDELVNPLPPGVKILGAIPRAKLARHQMETKVWAFPFEPALATEGFAVSALEALAAGCWAIARPDDALQELYGDAIEWIPTDLCDDAFRDKLVDRVVEALLAEANPRARHQADVVGRCTWEACAVQIERALRARTPGQANTMGDA